VQAQAERRTHAGRVLMTRKLGRVARGVKRDYCTRYARSDRILRRLKL
jgi:hypothetical protein